MQCDPATMRSVAVIFIDSEASLNEDTLREFPFFLGRFMTQVEHDISDFEEAGEALPGGVSKRELHHHVEDDEL